MQSKPPMCCTTFKDYIFVFGSNLAGRHGKGAALHARLHHGAVYGSGEGIQGSSYAIPTKDIYLKSLPLIDIEVNVHTFLRYARANPNKEFFMTKIGCGLAGYSEFEIAPMFKNASLNVNLPYNWR